MPGVRFLSLMNLKLLTKDEFIGTFSEPMKNVTGEDFDPIVDIWPYVEEAFTRELPGVSADDAEVDYVYLSGDEQYHHVGISFGEQNVYLVVVVSLKEGVIYGYHLLDLNEEYGLS